MVSSGAEGEESSPQLTAGLAFRRKNRLRVQPSLVKKSIG
jgi:hypothetical protein